MSFLDLNELAGENERLKDGNAGNYLDNFVKLPEGAGHVVLRLLPPAEKGMFGRAKNPFYMLTRTHRVNGKSLHCRKEFVNGKWVGDCEICNYYRWLWEESEKKGPEECKRLQDQYRAIKAVERYYYNTIVRQQYNKETGEMERNVGPKIWAIGKTVHAMVIRGIVGDQNMDEKPLGDVTNITKGRDFKYIKTIRQSGNLSYPNYDTSKFLDESPAGTPEEYEKWMNNLHDLVALRMVKSNEELKHELKVHLGLATSDSSDDTTFSASEYSGASVSVAVPNLGNLEAKKEAPKVSEIVKPVATPAPAKFDFDNIGGKPLVDDDFMNELRNT